MNWDTLHAKLIRAARQHPPADDVPYAFEQRVMARLRTTLDSAGIWSGVVRALWCAAGACTAITILISVWSAATLPAAVPVADNFTADLEATILASVFDPQVEFETDLELLW